MRTIKVYKVFENDWTCKDFQYEVGKEFTYDGEIKICESGFHACEKLQDCFKYAVHNSNAVSRSVEVNESTAVHNSKAVNKSRAVHNSKSVNKSIAVHESNAVNKSRAVHNSVFIDSCDGVSNSLFCANLESPYRIFNKEVSRYRYEEVRYNIETLMNGWLPEPTNIKSLYVYNDNDWIKTPAQWTRELLKAEMYQGMPSSLIEYIKSLPEFDDKIFEQITCKKIKNHENRFPAYHEFPG